MDGVDDLLNENHVVEEEEEDDEELGEEMADIAGSREDAEQEQDEEQDDPDDQEDQDEQEDQEDQDEDMEQSQYQNQDEDEDMDAEDEDNDDNDDNDDNTNANDVTSNGTEDTGEAQRPRDGNENYSRSNSVVNAENTREKVGRGPSSAFEKIYQFYSQLHNAAKLADVYSIYPTAAIPIQTHVHSLAMSKGLKYLFLGGEDGYVRKYDFLNTIEGKLSLTILQKHSLVESISNAGILLSYWENEVPQRRDEIKLSKTGKEYDPVVSPVHAIDVQSECLFLLSGLQNGGITMQGCRFMEGHIAHYFKKHTSTVNQLKLNNDESRFISGSWDKQVLEWDLNSGECINEFKGSSAQISSLEFRPLFSSVEIQDTSTEDDDDVQMKADDDDLDSLFGDEEEEEKRKAQEENTTAEESTKKSPEEEISRSTLRTVFDENTFLGSCTNGSIQIWDRRIASRPAMKLMRGPQTPPWCMSACWSTDGDRVYAGRRNATVEEYDLKMGGKTSKTLKFPSISGPVSCVRSMPNNKHVLCASHDNVRIYDVSQRGSSKVPFLIVPGHHGGMISNLYVDPTCRFLISTSGDRGWQGVSTDATLIYDIDVE